MNQSSLMLRTRLEPSVSATDPVFDRIVEAIINQTPIVYSKINHGFWERLVAIETRGYRIHENDPEITVEMDQLDGFLRSTPHMFEGGFVKELIEVLKSLPLAGPDYIFSAGLLGWPGRLEIAGLTHDKVECQAMIDRFVPEGVKHKTADGMEFKRAIISGSFVKFAAVIRDRKFLLVGNSNLTRYAEFISAEQGQFLEIHPSEARRERDTILSDIIEVLEADKDLKMVLLQSGGSLSAWLIHHLHIIRPDVSFIDVGLGSLICNPQAIFKSAFGRIYRRQLAACMEAVHPEWLEKQTDKALSLEVKTGRSDATLAISAMHGIAMPSGIFDPEIEFFKAISALPPQPVDQGRVSKILEACETPAIVTARILKHIMNLPDEEDLVLCPTREKAFQLATAILSQSGEAVESWKAGPFLGPPPDLAVEYLDCDGSGNLSREILKQAKLNENSGVAFSNLFGSSGQAWGQVREYCAAFGIPLIVDNAAGLLDRPATPRRDEIEIVGADSTLPWGVSEAAFLILSPDQKKLADGLAKDGDLLPEHLCAQWLDRLERYPHWSFFYKRQARRMQQVIARHIPELNAWPGNPKSQSPANQLHYLSPHPVLNFDAKDLKFEITKGLLPVAPSSPQAKDLHDRLISIPCHPYMRHVSAEDVASTVRALTNQTN